MKKAISTIERGRLIENPGKLFKTPISEEALQNPHL